MAITEQLGVSRSIPLVKKRRRKDAFAWVALAPSMLWSTAFLIFPLGLVVWYSFTDWSGFNTPQFQGLVNYRQLASPDFGNALRVTAIFAVGGAVATIAIAFGLSVLIQQRLRGWRFYRVLWFTPSLIPGAVIALLWVSGAYYPTKGLADTIIRAIGFTPPAEGWLDTPRYALVALMITAIWATTGFPMLLLSAAMERIPAEIAEAGRIDGAGRLTLALRITFPLIRPIVATVFALQVIGLMKTFDLIYIMTFGGPGTSTTTLAYLMYNAAFIGNKSGLASSYAVIMVLLILPLGFLTRGWIGAKDE
jgi:ABC-type sugar transport system permease subunit